MIFKKEIKIISRIEFPFRESVKSGHCCPCQPTPPPPVLVTTSPITQRMIRQSSQPEASPCCCTGYTCHLHTVNAPSAASLRQLREPGDGIAGIAADSLRINGGIRQFRQVNSDSVMKLCANVLCHPSHYYWHALPGYNDTVDFVVDKVVVIGF